MIPPPEDGALHRLCVSKKRLGFGLDGHGTGGRSPAAKWKHGIAVFSDYQLRPMVQWNIAIPSNWYVNSTPGGCYWHVSKQVIAISILPRLDDFQSRLEI
ncbi:uncharacterized protein LOC135687778 [Rhopilema esculentum]|uniref:uncharacterized protein LOC135687778 n=1 Tax=Rhopilema esculentum TaxID=499914 RepID=UPI0031D618A3